MRTDDSQVMREVDFIFKKDRLSPKMLIIVERESFAAADDSDSRITFDSNVRSRTGNLDIARTGGCELYFDEPTVIMEVKTAAGMPAWLVETLSAHQIYPSSFSKYGKMYQKNQHQKRAEMQTVVAYA